MTTKTSTKTPKTTKPIADQIADLEQARLAEVEAITTAINETDASIAETEQQLEDAEEHLEAIKADVAAGSGTPAHYTEAKLAVEFAELVLEGVKQRTRSLRRKVPVASCEVADALLPIIAELLPGVQVHSTFITPPTPTQAEVPVAYLVQAEEATIPKNAMKGSGLLTAKVQFHYFAGITHRPIDRNTLALALDNAQIRLASFLNPSEREHGNGMTETIIRITPAAIAPAIPVVQQADYAVSGLGRKIASDLAKTNTRFRRVVDSNTEEITDRISGGVRTTVVRVTATTGPYQNPVNVPEAEGTPESVMDSLVGTFHSHVGRITGAQVKSKRFSETEGEFVAEIELASRAV